MSGLCSPLVSPDFQSPLLYALIPSGAPFILFLPLDTLRGLKLSQASGSSQDPVTTEVLGQGHEVVVGNAPRVLRGLGHGRRGW